MSRSIIIVTVKFDNQPDLAFDYIQNLNVDVVAVTELTCMSAENEVRHFRFGKQINLGKY